MRSCSLYCLLAATALVLLPINVRSDAAEPTDSVELTKIYDADQKHREAPLGDVDWLSDRGTPPAESAYGN